MAKRSPEDSAELSRAVEAGEYTVAGPLEFGATLHEGRSIEGQPDSEESDLKSDP